MHSTARQISGKRYHFSSSQGLLAGSGRQADCGLVGGRIGGQTLLLKHPVGKRRVIVVAAQSRIATRSDHFKNALRQTQNRNVEGSTAQVVNGIDAFAGVIKAIGNGRRGGLIDQAQQMNSRQLGRILGGLALGVIEISRHSNDRTVQIVIEGVFGAVTQRGQYLGADFDR